MEDLLQSWGLGPDVVAAFTEADVNLVSLSFLSDAAIARIIPKEGPRCLFLHHLSEYKNKRVEPAASSSNSIEPPPKKSKVHRNTVTELQATPDVNDLHRHLKKSIPGLTVLGYYKARKRLDHYSRDLLGHQAINKEMDLDCSRSLTREDFKRIAESIVELFPTESEVTWYHVSQKNKRSVVDGRLRFKWYSILRGLRSAMLVPRSQDCEGDDSDDDNDPDDDEGNSDLNLLLTECNDWTEVEGAWKSTSTARQKIFKKCNFVIHDYIQKFPCLERNLGWKLLAEDGEKQFPVLKDHVNLWNKCVPFFVQQIQAVTPRFNLLKDSSPDIQFMQIILALPSLWRVKNLPKSSEAPKSGKCWRPSFDEILQSVCLHVEDIGLIREKINRRKKTLQKFCFPLQPVAVVVGPLNNIKQCFILLNDYRWEVESPIEAVLGILKICFGLGAKYPAESEHIWLFLQRVVFGVTTPQDFKSNRGLKSQLAACLKDFAEFCK